MKVYEELRDIILKFVKSGKDPLDDIIGQAEAKKQLLSSILAGRPVIIVGPPGVGKTTLAKNIAKILPPLKFPKGIPRWAFPEFPFTPEEFRKKWEEDDFIKIPGSERFIRIQGSPDLTVEDLIGDLDPMLALKYGPLSIKAFTPGKIFRAHKGVLFFDELNRAPPKVQNALLQLLEEKKIVIGSYEFEIPIDFIFIATMNPEDFAGTERLSDVLLDRFDIVYMDYPENLEIEKEIVERKGKKILEVDDEILNIIVSFVRYLRSLDSLERKPSVRVSIGIYEKSQILAILKGKKKVDLEDIKESLVSVLAHRIRLKPSIRIEKDEKEFIKEEFEKFLKLNNFSAEEEKYEKKEEKKIRTEGNKGYSYKSDFDKDAKFIHGMINRGIFKIDPEVFLKDLKNLKEAKRFYGKNIIEYLTDEKIERIKKNYRIPEFRNKIKENLSRKIRELRRKKILDRNYEFEEGVVLKYLLKIIEKEKLKVEGYLKNGIVESRGFGKGEKYDYVKGISKYFDIDIRRSIREIIRKRRIYYDTFVSKLGKEDKGYEFVVLLDSSGSMRGEKIDLAKKSAIALSYCSILDGNPVGILAFNDKIVLKEKPSLDFFNISRKILALRPLGLTDISLAIKESFDLFKDKGHLILISDAAPNVGRDPVKELIENVRILKEKGITFSIVGIDLDKEGEEICKKLSYEGNGKFYLVKDLKELDLIVLQDYFYFTKEAR